MTDHSTGDDSPTVFEAAYHMNSDDARTSPLQPGDLAIVDRALVSEIQEREGLQPKSVPDKGDDISPLVEMNQNELLHVNAVPPSPFFGAKSKACVNCTVDRVYTPLADCFQGLWDSD